MKTLLVDDSKTMRKILAGILKQTGMTDILEAADGSSAVGIVGTEGEAIGLVLMDWNMPNMNGYDALKVIRANGFKGPVVMVTTEAEKERIIDAIKAGASDYIIKPFTQDIVLTKIQKVLARFKAANA